MQQVIDLFNNWWQRPFDPEGDAINWILFLGFVVVVAFAWNKVLRQIITE